MLKCAFIIYLFKLSIYSDSEKSLFEMIRKIMRHI